MRQKLIGIGIAVSLTAAAVAQPQIKVMVENKPVTFDAPIIDRDGVTMVPLRNLVDAMGGTLRWDITRQTVTVWRASKRIDVTLNSRQGMVNGKTIQMDEAPFLNKGRLYAPLKFIAESSGYLVSHEKGAYVLRVIKV